MTRISKYISLLLIILLNGCDRNSYTNLDFLVALANETGIIEYKEEKPYYQEIDINNQAFAQIQALYEWDALKDDCIEFNSELTKDFLYKVSYNLIGDKITLLGLDNYPNKVNKEDATKIIKEIVLIINNQEFDAKNDIKFNEDIIEIKDFYFNKDNIITNEKVKINDIIMYKVNNKTTIKRIIDIQDKELSLEDVDILDLIENIDISNDISFNDTKSYIDILNQGYNSNEFDLISTFDQEFTYNNFNISWSFVNGRFHVYVSKKSDDLLNYYGEFDIYNINPLYKWKMKDGNLEHAYFKLNYSTLFKSGVSVGKYYDYYLDLDSEKSDDLLSSIKNKFKPKDEVAETTITLATIKVPVPQTYILDIEAKVQLHIYASGKIELELTNNNIVGYEIKNGNMRLINEGKKDYNINARASGNTSLKLSVGLNILGNTLMDVSGKVGIKGVMQTTAHIYDKNTFKSIKTDIPLDLLEEKNKSKNLKICGDLSLHWILELELNSKYSLASKLGFNKVISFLDEDNQIFQNDKTHIENFVFVDKCTVHDQEFTEELDDLNPNQIILNQYSHILKVNEGKELNIISTPKGYDIDDLIFNFTDNNIAYISNGKIVGKNFGNTILTISTKDNSYKVQVHILVSE